MFAVAAAVLLFAAAPPALTSVIVALPDGGAWLTEYTSSNVAPAYTGNRIAQVSSSLGLSELPNLAMQTGVFDGTRYDAKPRGIAVSAPGQSWFAEYEAGDPGYRLGTTGGASGYTEYTLAAMGIGAGTPRTIRKAPDGKLWFTVTGGHGTPTTTPPLTGDPDPGTATPAPPATGGFTPPVTTTTVAPVTTSTAQLTNPTVKGDNVSLNQICVGPPSDPCSLVYLLQTREYVKGFPNAKAQAKPKLTTIGQLKVTLKGGESKKVTIKLNSKGKKLKSFKATLTVTQTVKEAKKPKQVLKKNLTFKR